MNTLYLLKSKWKLLLLTALVMVFTGCTLRELEVMPDSGNLNLFFDWSGLSETGTIPASMKVLFYNASGDTLSVSGGSEAQQANLPFGSYKMLTYSTASQGVGFRHLDKFGEAEAYALPLSLASFAPRALRMAFAEKSNSYLAQPRELYGVGGNRIDLFLGDASSDTLKPQTLIKQISLDISINGDRSSVTTLNLTLDNIASGVSLSTGLPISGNPGTTAFGSDASTSGFTTTVSYFGQDTTVVDHAITLVFEFVDGGSQVVTTDFSTVMEQAEEAVIPVDVKVDVDVTHTDVGFKATLQGWKMVEGTIVADELPIERTDRKKITQ